MDTTTPYDRADDPGLPEKEVMLRHMDPAVPCGGMPTRPCIARWEEGQPIFAATQCQETCWRFEVPTNQGDKS